MRKLSQKNWLLLGYLALLFNLGPSLHHADFFGLHCHDAGCCSTSVSQDDASSCCCVHSHDQHSTENSSDGIEVEIAAANEGCNSSCEDCAFCKFFDQYNVVSESFDFVLTQSPVCSLVVSSQGTAFCEFVPKSARGPPAFFPAEMAV